VRAKVFPAPPVAPTILSDLYPVERRGRILAWFYLAIPVGSALGYVLGGAVAVGGRARMEADDADAESRRPLELLR